MVSANQASSNSALGATFFVAWLSFDIDPVRPCRIMNNKREWNHYFFLTQNAIGMAFSGISWFFFLYNVRKIFFGHFVRGKCF